MIGKTNLDEFAMGCSSSNSIRGSVKNPWRSGLPFRVVDGQFDDESKSLEEQQIEQISQTDSRLVCSTEHQDNQTDCYIAGGSSGGSAVAVACGACFGALASDTGGSTRNPASRVGVIGFKPSYGLLSRHGLVPLTHSMDVPGIMARTVDCCEQIFSLIRGVDPKDSTSIDRELQPERFKAIQDFRGLKIGIPDEYDCDGLSEEIRQLWRQTADYLANCGAHVQPVRLPHSRYSLFCYLVLNSCEVASNFACYDGIEFGSRKAMENLNELESKLDQYSITRDQFDDEVKQRIFQGNYFLLRENYENYFVRALKIRRLIIEDFNRAFKEQNYDLLLTPVTKTEAPRFSEYTDEANYERFALEDFCTQAVNMAGLPAISVPARLSSNGLPLSLQLIAPLYRDYELLAASELLEHHFEFPSLVYAD